jgi:hypothetical protein
MLALNIEANVMSIPLLIVLLLTLLKVAGEVLRHASR